MAETSKLVLEIDSDGVVKASGNLEAFSEAAANADRAARGLESAVREASGAQEEMAESGASVDSVLGGLNLGSLAAAAGVSSLVAAMAKMAGAVVDFGKSSVQTYSQFELIQNSLSGVMRDAEKGKELFEDLRSFSFDTTFGVDTLANAATQLLSVGTAMDDLKPRLKQIGDIAGGDTNKFNELVSIFTKIQNTGKASAEQLQQLALRGVPIYQVLQQIGVEGTATASDIVAAFDEMTGASGIFYNNMQSINDTISGKEGFVSDTWREFLASFAEATGLADMYKAALDTVYDALQGVVDWLGKINENPVAKALLSGAIAALLSTLAVTIGVTIVTALTQVIVKLGIIAALKSVISPTTLLIGAGIGLVTGAVVGLGMALSDTEEEVESLTNTADGLNGLASNISDITMSIEEAQEHLGSGLYNKDSLDAYRVQLHAIGQDLDSTFRTYGNSADWRNEDVSQYFESSNGIDNSFADDEYQMILQLKEAYNEYLGKYKETQIWVSNQNVALERQKTLVDMIKNAEQDRINKMQTVHDIYKGTSEYQKQELETQITMVKNLLQFGNFTVRELGSGPTGSAAVGYTRLNADERREAEAVLNELESRLASLNRRSSGAASSAARTWKDAFKDVTDVTVTAGMNGADAVDAFVTKLEDAHNREVALSSDLDKNFEFTPLEGLETARNRLKEIESAYYGLFEQNDSLSGGEKFTVDSNSVKALAAEWQNAREEVRKAQAAAEKYEETLKYDDEVKALEQKRSLIGLIGAALDEEMYRQQGLNDEHAKALAALKQEVDLQERIANAKSLQEKGQLMKDIASQGYAETGTLNAGQYAGGAALSAAGSMVQGTDVGNAIDGFKNGGVWGAVIEVVLGALVKVAKQFDNFDKVMNPVTEWMQKLAPLLQFVFDILEMVVDIISAILDFLQPFMIIIQAIGKALKNTVGKFISWIGELVQKFSRWILGDKIYDRYNSQISDEKQTELERLKELNKQYQSLSSAIDEQNQYYLKQRQLVEAQSYDRLLGATKVNDLIVTKNGTFSTHPEDTIFAMKHPEDLARGGNLMLNVQINNARGGDTDVAVERGFDLNGNPELIVNISRKVAVDYAKGANGWDSAEKLRARRNEGRRVTS